MEIKLITVGIILGFFFFWLCLKIAKRNHGVIDKFDNACKELSEELQPEMDLLDLTQKVKWKFEKTSGNNYIAWFYNPCVDAYWMMPDSRAYLQGEWSFQNMAGYGAYELSKIEIRHEQIDWFADQYKTLSDIQFYFDTLVKKWHAYEEEQKKIEQLPYIIEK